MPAPMHPRDPAFPEPGYVKQHVTRTSSVRPARVSRVAASIVMAGRQETQVRLVPTADGQAIALRIGQLLIYLEDTTALTELVEAAAAAHAVGDRAFGLDDTVAEARRLTAWQTVHRRTQR